MSIVAVGFLDLSAFTATFVRNYRERVKDDANYPGAQTLLLRGADAEAPILKEWKSAQQILKRIRNEGAKHLGKPAELGKAMVVSLRPGAFVPWSHSDDEYTLAHVRLYVNMIPCPRAFIYSGGAAANPPVGEVVAWNQQDLHSEINVGTCTRVSLIVDIKRPGDD